MLKVEGKEGEGNEGVEVQRNSVWGPRRPGPGEKIPHELKKVKRTGRSKAQDCLRLAKEKLLGLGKGGRKGRSGFRSRRSVKPVLKPVFFWATSSTRNRASFSLNFKSRALIPRLNATG